MVKASASRATDLAVDPFSGSSHTSDLKIGIPEATLVFSQMGMEESHKAGKWAGMGERRGGGGGCGPWWGRPGALAFGGQGSLPPEGDSFFYIKDM